MRCGYDIHIYSIQKIATIEKEPLLKCLQEFASYSTVKVDKLRVKLK